LKYKVCILAAGIGSRMGGFTKEFNKALLPINGKPVICHIIEKFSEEVPIVIAVGYKKNTIIEYLTHNYLNRKFKFVVVDNFSGVGSGPGYSLLCCKEHLNIPFIQFAADTLVLEDIPIPTRNWIGIAPVTNTKRFCSVRLVKNKVTFFDDKTDNNNKFAYIGLFGVNNTKSFWKYLKNSKNNLIDGEVQVSNGLSSLIYDELNAEYFHWYDVGTLDSYNHALRNFPHGEPYANQ